MKSTSRDERKVTVRPTCFSLRIILVCAVLSAAGCGGGGGGGGGNETGIRVLHGAVDAAPVDVVAAGQVAPLVSGAAFALPSDYSPLPEGPVGLSLTRALTPANVVATHTLTVNRGDRYTLLLYGDNETLGLRTRLLSDVVPESIDGSAIVRIVDGTTGAQTMRVFSGAASPSKFLVNVEFGSASEYLPVPPGPTRFLAVRAADGRSLATGSLELQGGSAYTILFAGEADYYVKAVVYQD